MANTVTREQLLIAARRSLFKKSYYEFFKYFWSETSAETLVDNWHIRVLCDELQQIANDLKERKSKRYDLVINISPGTSKSTIVTVLFPVYCWIIDPTLRLLTGSYAQTLSLEHAVKSRTVINSPRFRELFPEITLQEDQNNKGSYNNKAQGNRTATSVGSGILGKHYHCIIIDDPITATASPAETKTANEWMDVSLSTRKIRTAEDITVTILVMQRINQNDPSSVMISKPDVKHISLPAELTADTSTGYVHHYEHGLFDPIRLNRNVLNKARLTLGSIAYTGQFLQNPVPAEGGVIKKEWFSNEPLSEKHNPIVWEMFIDSAYTNKQENDASALLIGGLLGNTLYVRKVFQYWLEFPQLLEQIKLQARQYGVNRVHIEPKASGLSIIQTLRQSTGLNIIELPTTRDGKLARVNAVAPVLESKRVVLIEDASWNTVFVDECTGFPLTKNDDMLDTLVYAINKLLQTRRTPNYASF